MNTIMTKYLLSTATSYKEVVVLGVVVVVVVAEKKKKHDVKLNYLII